MSDTKLLPCPFCGGTKIGWRYVEAYSLDSSHGVFGCEDCGVTFLADSDTEESCADRANWNRRAALSTLPIAGEGKVDPDRALKDALFAQIEAGRQSASYGGVLVAGGKYAYVTFDVRYPSSPGKDGGQEVEAISAKEPLGKGMGNIIDEQAKRDVLRPGEKWRLFPKKTPEEVDRDPVYQEASRQLKPLRDAFALDVAPSPQSTVDADAVIDRLTKALEPFSFIAGELFAKNYNDSDIVFTVQTTTEKGSNLKLDVAFSTFREARNAIGSIKAKSPSSDRAASEGLSPWAGWDKSNYPWSAAHHKDSVCYAAFGETWSMEDAHALISFIDRTWGGAEAKGSGQ